MQHNKVERLLNLEFLSVLVLPLPCCVALGESLHICVPHCSHLERKEFQFDDF